MTWSPTLSALHHLIACHSWLRLILSAVCWKNSQFNITTMSKFKTASRETREGLKFKVLPEEACPQIPLVASVLCIVVLRRTVWNCSCCTLTLSGQTIPLHVTQKETQGTKHRIYSSSNSRYLVKNYAMLSTTNVHAEVLPLIMCKLKRLPWVTDKAVW